MEKVSCAERIKSALDIRELKAADLCKMTGINKSTMSQYLQGLYEPSQVKTELIACALKIDEAWLMGYNVPMSKEKPTPLPESGLSKQFIDLFSELTPDQQEFVVSAMKGMKSKE